MNELTPDRFEDFFQSLYGYEPFPWQTKLARQVAGAQPGDSSWPEALTLPTAAGKTACIDMAIFALACQAGRCPEKRTAPRRIFFVVDRRVIVDATFERARELAANLHKAKDDGGIVGLVADRLRFISGIDDPDQPPLACFQLRGGMYRDDAWARSPLQPTVVVTTVDQFGSRLLFRGYGSSAGMRPIHAGLAANDCLILLDEAHCANPFRQTAQSVKRYRQWAAEPGSIGATPFHFTLISATPPADIKASFTDGEEDLKHERLGRRINAPKPAKLVVARNARGGDVLEGLARRVSDEAIKLVSDDIKAIGLMVNRVATAKLAYEELRKDGKDATLLTGRMRAIDRDDIVRDLESLKTGADREKRTRFIVATQTLEVGADLDFDGLVTECASLDALRQRFGRLNRDGRRDIEAKATVVVRADQTNPASKTAYDPVYGAALSETWQWLNAKSVNGEVDFGYAAMKGIIPDRGQLHKLSQQAADAPVMLPAHVDAWAQTSPVPVPDPNVAIFLHGPQRGAPEVQVCWRADLSEADLSESGQRAIDIVSLCPPTSSECISVPIHRLRRWLEGNDESVGREDSEEDSDVEGAFVPDDSSQQRQRQFRHSVLCWRGPEDSRPIAAVADLHPGDTVVIPAESGGWDSFGHKPPDSPVDLGDRAYLQSRAKAILRIHPELVKRWPSAARALVTKFAEQTEETEDSDKDENELREALSDINELVDADLTPQWTWLKDAASALSGDRRLKKLAHPGGGWVIQGSHRIQKYTNSAGTLTSEDDSYSATVRVSLDDHLKGVESWAKRIGWGSGLPEPLAADLALAARLHDVGKADLRFQAMLYGGNRWAAVPPLLAKSDRLSTSRRERERARRQSDYPKGGRHELLSVRMIENSGLLECAHDKDLVLHLVASHHGYCRPFAPVVENSNPIQVEETILGITMSACTDTQLERLDSGVPERFWRLARRYGWWGLAWLEALMRLADHRCSEDEQK
jgi:CRISPR-associated endonuclease/helicase Cas3